MVLNTEPSLILFPAFCEFVKEMTDHGEKLWEPYVPKAKEDGQNFVCRLLARADRPEQGLVAESIYWGVVSEVVVGRISLRHRLAGNLYKIGGHVGYEVRPSFRRKGIATAMLAQILQTSKAKEIGRLLLTCAPDNVASNKTIMNNGGQLEKTIYVDLVGAERNHYWINLSG